jgi:hypothetical protein
VRLEQRVRLEQQQERPQEQQLEQQLEQQQVLLLLFYRKRPKP